MKNLKVGQVVYGKINEDTKFGWVSEMEKWINKPMTIENIDPKDGHISVKENNWSWCEKTITEKPIHQYKKGDKVKCLRALPKQIINVGEIYTVKNSFIGFGEIEYLEFEEIITKHNYDSSRFEPFTKPEPKYKVGDKLEIKKYEDCPFSWVSQMDRLVGDEITIRDVSYKEYKNEYVYTVVGQSWEFCENCFTEIRTKSDYILQLGDKVVINGIEDRLVIETNEGYNCVREGRWDLAYECCHPSLENITEYVVELWSHKSIKVETVGGKTLWLSK